MKSLLIDNKRGQLQLPAQLIWSVVGFMVAVIVGVLIVTTLNTSNLFTANSAGANTTSYISNNLTTGIDSVTNKFPTMFTVIGIVVVLAILGLLVVIVRKFGMPGGGSFSQ